MRRRPGPAVYNTSGRILRASATRPTSRSSATKARAVATARVQVLRVTASPAWNARATAGPRRNPRGVAFMGVGFDRTGAQGTEPGVPRNPFVSLVSLASGAPLSSVRPGYIVTREGVHLGMSAELHARLCLRQARAQPGVAAGRAGMERHAHGGLGRRRHGQRHDPGRYRHQLHVPVAARGHAAGARHARAGRQPDRRLHARPAQSAAGLLRLHRRRPRQPHASGTGRGRARPRRVREHRPHVPRRLRLSLRRRRRLCRLRLERPAEQRPSAA